MTTGQTSARRTPKKTARKTSSASPHRRAAKVDGEGGTRASERISARIAELADWRGEVLGRVRRLIQEAEPEILEEWKWNTPVWSRGGIVCTGESYSKVVKLTFAKGASVTDPTGLFNSSLAGNVRRAIDIREGDDLHEPAFKDLVRAAVALNLSGNRR